MPNIDADENEKGVDFPWGLFDVFASIGMCLGACFIVYKKTGDISWAMVVFLVWASVGFILRSAGIAIIERLKK